MEETPILAALESGVLTLTLNRPQRLNAMNHPLIEAVIREFARTAESSRARAPAPAWSDPTASLISASPWIGCSIP